MHDLGTLPPRRGSRAMAITELGDAVGWAWPRSEPADGGGCAILFRDGTVYPLGNLMGECTSPPGQYYASLALDINNVGQIVGWSSWEDAEGNYTRTAYLYSDGTMYVIPGGTPHSYAYGINDLGQVVGQSFYPERAWIFSSDWGAPQFLVAENGYAYQAAAINNASQVVGVAHFDGQSQGHAYLWQDGVLNDLGTSGSSSAASDINEYGEVVGYSDSGPFLYAMGAMHYLNDLVPASSGWELTSASAINDRGLITGGGLVNGEPHAYLLTPGAYVGYGANVSASVGSQVTLDFASVATGGTVTGARAPQEQCMTPGNFALLPDTCYDLAKESSLSFSAPVKVCIAYDPARIEVPESLLRLQHYAYNPLHAAWEWLDTTLLPVDTQNNRVCGETDSLSLFAAAEPIYSEAAMSIKAATVGFARTEQAVGTVHLWADLAAKMPPSDAVITGIVDGVTLFSVPFSQFKGAARPNTYRYANKKGLDAQIDFAGGSIFVVAPNIDLSRLTYADGADVQFIIDGADGMQIGFQHIEMTSLPGSRLVYSR
jgi:probable HAF family extracellular repeat protein